MISFRLSDDFVEKYVDKQPPWGFGINGNNAIGEITFIRTYSRIKPDGSKERWWEVCERVINGMYSVQKDHVKSNKLPWNDRKAQASAQEAFDRMFNLKWTPPGRGLWMMGVPFVMDRKQGGALQNCAMWSSADIHKNDPGAGFAWVMDALMLGVGVGFDTLGADKQIVVQPVSDEIHTYQIPDTREGWVESVRLQLNSMLKPGHPAYSFDYSLIRQAGEPIRGFGGTASGAGPLIQLHNQLNDVIGGRAGETLDSRAIVDIVNLIGTCVVAGNVRRSATLALGHADDKEFINLKNPDMFPDRNSYDPAAPGWGWMCVPYNTWTMTDAGPRQVKNLIDRSDFKIVVGDSPYSIQSNGFFKTSNYRQLHRVITKQGFEFEATDNHPMMSADGWKMIKDLQIGDKLKLSPHNNIWEGAGGTEEFGYLSGLVWSDGWIVENKATICLYGDKEYNAQQSIVIDALRSINSPANFMSVRNGSEYRLTSKILASKLNDLGIMQGHKKISDKLETMSYDFYRGFIAGAFDGDGTAAKYHNNEHGRQLILSQSDKEQLIRIQRMLMRLGIYSTIRSGSKTGFAIKQPYTLAISSSSLDEFMSTIPVISTKFDDVKLSMTKWNRRIRNEYYVDVVDIVKIHKDAVYDITVDDIHSFEANGFLVHNSNNSIVADDITDFTQYVDLITDNGEPGFIWLDRSRQYGRLKDGINNKDWRVRGFNPCAEQSLESMECCTLVEVHLNKHDSYEDFRRSLKFAYLYGKTVTLLPTEWEQTNAVMQRNRRIGTSLTGIANFTDKHGIPTTTRWMDDGYEAITYYDKKYSEWLGIRESIKTTTVKPSGTVSLLSGASPGVHWSPGSKYYLRSIRFANNDKMLDVLTAAGYRTEPALQSANTTVVYFPVQTDTRSEREVTIFEKMHLATIAQRYWSDNSVSVTVSFDKNTESSFLSSVMHMFGAQLKTVSFLPMGNDVYPQQPYTSITADEYNDYASSIRKIDWGGIYSGYDDAAGERYCSNDTCML